VATLDIRRPLPLHGWIADECSRSNVKNSLAILVRIMEQAVRDGIIDRNPGRLTGWQRDYRRAEDELDDPRSVALPNWEALEQLAAALVARSADHFAGWGETVMFAATIVHSSKRPLTWGSTLISGASSNLSGRRDLNPRPLDPQSSALPSWATSRC
jgi:hypothetical protein